MENKSEENIGSIGKVLFTKELIAKRVEEIGYTISCDYEGKSPVIISVLKGSLLFFSDLVRNISLPVQIDLLSIGIFPGITSETGMVKITKDLDISITGRHVILVEDIIGTGLTLGYLIQHLEMMKPASVNVCTLLDNPAGRLLSIHLKYIGFSIPDVYVIGYGMDYKENFRNLPYIAEFNWDK
jgi:hypoxanthine phosphoribosyltransferase